MAGQAGNEDEVAGRAAVIGRDEAIGVEYVATKEGVAVHGIDVTPDSVTEGVAAAVVEDEETE